MAINDGEFTVVIVRRPVGASTNTVTELFHTRLDVAVIVMLIWDFPAWSTGTKLLKPD
jgi:hypothetical protein